jgi:hypothetical protein
MIVVSGQVGLPCVSNFTCAHLFLCLCKCKCKSKLAKMLHACARACMCVFVRVCVDACVCIHMLCVCVCLCTCVQTCVQGHLRFCSWGKPFSFNEYSSSYLSRAWSDFKLNRIKLAWMPKPDYETFSCYSMQNITTNVIGF